MFQNLINIITSPQAAFDAIREKPKALFPLALIVIMTALVQILYFANMDQAFMIDMMVEQAQAIISVPEGELRESLADSSPMTQGITSAIAIFIFVPIVFSIIAGYLNFTSKFGSDEINFKSWFALTVWTSTVTIFAALASIVVVLMSSDGMVTQGQLQVLSLNSLIFQSTGPFQGLLSGIDLTQLWSLVLTTLGYKSWTGKSMFASALIVSFPYLLIYGIWSLVIIF